MGNNVVALIHTDELDSIMRCPDYGARLTNAILSPHGQVFGFNTQVLDYDHADATQVILAGQNAIRRLDVYLPSYATAEDAEMSLLKALARKLNVKLPKDLK